MKIFLGADHRGFQLKEQLKTWLVGEGHEVEDVGATTLIPDDDYPDYAVTVGKHVASDPAARGIILCGSGIGMAVAANKLPDVRAGVVTTPALAKLSRQDDNLNVLALAAEITTEAEAKEIVGTWLQTEFSGEDRHRRRLDKIAQLEK